MGLWLQVSTQKTLRKPGMRERSSGRAVVAEPDEKCDWLAGLDSGTFLSVLV